MSTLIHIEFKQKKGDELVMITKFDCAEIEKIIRKDEIIDLGEKNHKR